MAIWNTNMKKNCKQCGKEFYKSKSCSLKKWTTQSKFCSFKCYWESMNGVEVSDKQKLKISKTMKERGISPKVKWEKGMNPINIMKGEDNWNWKGGISKLSSYSTIMSGIRRSRINNSEGSHTFGEWDNLKIQYGFTCPCCFKSEPEIILTEDHIIPISKGGSNFIENIQPLCRSCNSKKHTKIIKY